MTENACRDAGYEKRRKWVSLFSLAVLLGFFALVWFTAGRPMLALLAQPERFRALIGEWGAMGKLAMIGMMALQVVVGMIPGEPMEIGAGYAFGALEGMVLCLIGALVGSCIIYAFTRLFGVKMVEAFISREKVQSLKFIRSSRRLDLLVFILFLIPGSPKDILTYFVGLTPMKLSRFLVLSSIARIPSVISSTVAGAALGAQNYWFAAGVAAVTAVVSGAGILLYRHVCKSEEREQQATAARACQKEGRPKAA